MSAAGVDRAPRTGRGGGPGWFRAGLQGLTTRGRSFVAAGLAAAACAFLLGQRDLLRVGVLLVAVPVVCAVVVGRSQLRVSLERTITPARVVVGTTARVRLELTNLDRTATTVLLAEDHIPYSLGTSPRFVVSRLPGGRRASVSYTLRTSTRGRYPVGPLSLTTSDPFGMCELTRSFTATDPLVVLPQTFPLEGAPSGGQWVGQGEAVRGMVAASGEHDLAVREYRRGDDLRRVHWRSTARRGELMVRRDEQPRQMQATVVLDTRHHAHRGEGAASSFEWAVGAAASAARHLAGQRYAVRLVAGEDKGHQHATIRGSGDDAEAMERLAVVQTGGSGSISTVASLVNAAVQDGVVVAVLGDLSEADAAAMARALPPRTAGVALLLDAAAWAHLPPAVARELTDNRRRAARALRAAGWSVAEAGPRTPVPDAWRAAMTGAGSGAQLDDEIDLTVAEVPQLRRRSAGRTR